MSDLQRPTQRHDAQGLSRAGAWYVITRDGEGRCRQWEAWLDHRAGWREAWSRAREQAADGEAEWVLLWDVELGPPPSDRIEALIAGRGDVLHSGLALGLAGLPKLLSLIWPTWMLGADADPTIESTSWRLSLRACLLRAELLRQQGDLREDFESFEAAGLELGLRYLHSGAILRHTPVLVSAGRSQQSGALPWLDEVKLAASAGGRKWATYAALRAWQKGWCRWAEVVRALTWLRSASPKAGSLFGTTFGRERPGFSMSPAAKVSVLIPTLDRYPYLETLLGQLSSQTVPPHQVIVVDQTPKERRRRDLQDRFATLPLVWIEQDEPGQCSSRNEGLRRATGEWVLFLDDDVEVPENLIEKHLSTAAAYQADAVSGVVTEPGQLVPSVPSGPPRISSVFPAGNTLLRRCWLERSGFFDLAYDHGQRADGDLGMRVYLSGALMIMDPHICILHHHAPRGGLRAHKVRRLTRALSKRSVWLRNLPSAWDFYLSLRYFGPQAAAENALCLLASSLTCEGEVVRRALRFVVATLLLPSTWRRIQRARRQGAAMLAQFPQIPVFQSGGTLSSTFLPGGRPQVVPLIRSREQREG